MKGRHVFLLSLAALVAAVLLRTAWLTADPPVIGTVGVVWHDEGAWVHNARNRALWGEWRTDDWNPMYVAPVFTGLEYVAFATLGVGTWQARIVPVASGLIAVIALGWGLGACLGRRAAVIGLALLATNFFFVMWNRAALMESTLTACLVIAWAAYARAQARPLWGLVAGLATVLAFFTKAAAAFFVAAIGLEAGLVIALAWSPALRRLSGAAAPDPRSTRAAAMTMAGLAAAAAVALAIFVVPFWTEFRFYNWQMSVTRKPDYTLRAFADRASWLPIVHDVFSRMWFVLAAGVLALVAIVVRWPRTPTAGRLLAWWVLLGLAELIVHDSGNERRYVMFVPALVALACWLFAGGGPDREAVERPGAESGATDTADGARPALGRLGLLAVTPVLLLGAYLVWGALVRLLDLNAIYARDLSWAVRSAAALAIATVVVTVWRPRRLESLAIRPWSATATALLVGVILTGDLAQFGIWARSRTDFNYRASVAVGQALPPGTLVHGKLANGLSLENEIRPIFVGRGFGNYTDRFDRPDVPYILTYVLPRLAYEGDVLEEVVRAYPGNVILQLFPVNETPFEDVAALIRK